MAHSVLTLSTGSARTPARKIVSNLIGLKKNQKCSWHNPINLIELKTNLPIDQEEGASKGGPFDKLAVKMTLIWSISSKAISAQTKIDVMQHDIARCPKVHVSHWLPSILDSSSEVTSIRQLCFTEHLLLIVNSLTGEKVKAYFLL